MGWLAGLCVARAGASVMFMAYPTILAVVQAEWDLSAKAAGLISSGLQIGTAVALVVVSVLADLVDPRRVFVASAALATLVSFAIAALADGLWSGLLLFTVLAVALAGTYTPAVMLISARFDPARRGNAVGWFIASSSAGHVVALLAGGALVARWGWRAAIAGLALGPLACLGLALWLFRGDAGRGTTPGGFTLRLDLAGNRPAQLMIAGYVFHSWELLGMWAWAPAFVAAALVARGAGADHAAGLGANLSALFHVMGGVASWAGGWLSDRWGRTAVIAGMLAVSTASSFVFGWLLLAPVALLVAVGAVYGFSAVGDSAVFSTGLTETVPARRLGSVLALRSLLGFGVGAVAPVAFGVVLDAHGGLEAGPTGWGWAFATLGVGGALGLLSTLWLRLLPESRRLAGGRR